MYRCSMPFNSQHYSGTKLTKRLWTRIVGHYETIGRSRYTRQLARPNVIVPLWLPNLRPYSQTRYDVTNTDVFGMPNDKHERFRTYRCLERGKWWKPFFLLLNVEKVQTVFIFNSRPFTNIWLYFTHSIYLPG